jgi:sterol desaturase/sphingolipid hydroxylase (fatty acid hydroxylase superfamily)
MIGYAPMLVFVGISAPHALVAALMFRVWGFVNHANVRLPFGRLTVVVAGPQWHRIHHSVYPEHFDKNFAAFFPFIDRLFGTYYEPAQNEYPETGLPEASPSDLEQATTAPFAGWYRSMKGLAKNLTNQSKPTAA